MNILQNNALFFLKLRRRHLKHNNYKLQTLKSELDAYFNKEFPLAKKRRGPDLPRSSDWWENTVLKEFTDADWLETFRVTRNTFDYICGELHDEILAKPNFLNEKRLQRKTVSVEKKVGVSLYYLGTCCEYRVIADKFGIHKATVCKCLHEFVRGTAKILLPKHLRMPNEVQAMETALCFKEKCHIPNIIGVIDSSHIPILPPSKENRDYVNQKGWTSLVLQGVVDHKYRFIDTSIKCSGTAHDDAVFKTSNFYKSIDRLIPKSTIKLNGKDLPYIILGDPAYPLLPCLINGHSSKILTPEQESFNACINTARASVKIAFERLKGRWRCLLRRLDIHHSFVPEVVATCCTLHNITETFGDKFNDKWMKSVQEAEFMLPQPVKGSNQESKNYEGLLLRDYLSDYLGTNLQR